MQHAHLCFGYHSEPSVNWELFQQEQAKWTGLLVSVGRCIAVEAKLPNFTYGTHVYVIILASKVLILAALKILAI